MPKGRVMQPWTTDMAGDLPNQTCVPVNILKSPVSFAFDKARPKAAWILLDLPVRAHSMYFC